MDRLEVYLDQVCRGIAGPRSLRLHVRRELREHLLDAAAEHRSAGLSDDEAMLRALADFGAPEQVRSELEATHGHRLMAVVVDKAMQWKEKTMRAKWLWTTWTYLVVLGIIAINGLFLSFAQFACIPKLKKIESDGLINFNDINRDPIMRWLSSWIRGLEWISEHLTWMLLVATGLWLLFEWRVRSENKGLIRLSALGSLGLVLSIAVFFIAAAMSLPFFLGLPALGKLTTPYALEQLSTMDAALNGIEQSAAKDDWTATQEHVGRMQLALDRLEGSVSAIPGLMQPMERMSVADARDRLKEVGENLDEIRRAIREKNAPKLSAALTNVQSLMRPLLEAGRQRKQAAGTNKVND